MPPTLDQTLTRAECRAKGYRVFGWCPGHGWRASDLARPSRVDGLRLHSLFMRGDLKCGRCGARLTAVKVSHFLNAMNGEVPLVEWRIDD